MDESAIILKKYFETIYHKLEIEWNDENDHEMEKLSSALREEANEFRKDDHIILVNTADGEKAAVKYGNYKK